MALLIADVRMPGEMDGFALAQAARSKHKDLKVICMTDFLAEARGADTLLKKPFTVGTMLSAIEKAVG